MRAAGLCAGACILVLVVAAAKPEEHRTPIFDSRSGLSPGWTDLGWAPRQVRPGSPARIDFSARGGWIVSRQDLTGTFTWLTFRMKAPSSFGDFLSVRLDSPRSESFPRVRLSSENRRTLDYGASEIRLGMRELNPAGRPFDRVVFEAAAEVGHDAVLLDDIALTETEDGPSRSTASAHVSPISIDCSSPGRPISPLIYGVGPGDLQDQLFATARRWGGNANTRYNWQAGNAWNAGSDWFFRNVDYTGQPGSAWRHWLDENRSRGMASAITLPTIGWVAKDTSSYSFPVSLVGPQQAVAPENQDIGNGISRDGKPLTPLPPERTSSPAPPEFIARWVAAIRAKDQPRSVREYILDNEPTLWNSTHRDVHPAPVSYDELLERTISYGTAVRRADPEATIAGPALWGWTALFYSGADAVGGYQLHSDRRAHGNVPLLPWWLSSVRRYEKRTGVRLIDVLDVHFYPQARLGLGMDGATDAATAALRIRSTRALWDSSYRDESWINEPVKLLPRLREWIDANAPGVRISIGEYNFGAEGHMSGGLAVAEALGRFAANGVDSAFYWTSPKRGSPAFQAFNAFRNFDGKGAHFLEEWVPARASDPLSSVFASRDESGTKMVIILLRLDPNEETEAVVDLARCGRIGSSRRFRYSAGDAGFVEEVAGPAGGTSLRQRLLPYSMNVLALELAPTRR
jgi:hypothetical protein